MMRALLARTEHPFAANWMPKMWPVALGIIALTAFSLTLPGQASSQAPLPSGPSDHSDADYVLGPQDQVTIWALEVEEISQKPVRIDESGYINLPLAGRVQAAGLSVRQLENELTGKLKTYVRNPQISVAVSEYRSQPVSIIGAVNTPGVHPLQGKNSLIEALSMAGGLRADAGYSIKLTRRLQWGRIPLTGATEDRQSGFSVAEIPVKDLMEGKRPEENILVKPNDVISVPVAETIYVVGEVQKPGGFVLGENKSLTTLQALSLAGGLSRTASPGKAKILRSNGGPQRDEAPVDLKQILAGKAKDLNLHPNDILFVPTSGKKAAATRVIEAAISAGTGIAVYRSGR